MRKIIALAAVAAFLMAGCSAPAGGAAGETAAPASAAAEASAANTEETAAATEDAAAETAEATSEAPVAADAGTIGDVDAKILDAAIGKDYEDKPVILIGVEWTNNAEEATSAMMALMGTAFQDGVELDTAIVIDDDDKHDTAAQTKDIKPGKTQTVWLAYLLDNESSPVEFELAEAFSFDDAKLVKTFDVPKK